MLAISVSTDRKLVPVATCSAPVSAANPRVPLSILVAEDNSVNQRLIARMLEKRGHRVKIASNGSEAFELSAHTSFDLIFMDVQMPEMDGLAATTAIRERKSKSGQRLPIVALTAHAMKGDEQLYLSHGMDAYLTKPIRPAELDEILARLGPSQSCESPDAGSESLNPVVR